MSTSSTKIERLKLVNFIGIHAGLGINEIELDFKKTDKRFIIMLGKNGSGKSTIQSMLHPFTGSFDDRTDLIINGKDGRKEIDIRRDDVLYKITHHYSEKKNRSFITKVSPDGEEVELNPAGTIRNFPAIIEEELGVTESFFKLIKIGSQAENFIDLKASQRKEFIGEFTPNIEPYLDIFRTVTSKHSSTTKEIRFLTDELSKLDDSSSVQKSINILRSTERTMQEEIAKLMAQEQALKLKLADTTVLDEIEDLNKAIAKLNSDLEFYQSNIDDINTRYKGKLKSDTDSIDDIREKITVRETNLVTYTDKLAGMHIKAAELGQEIKSGRAEIDRIKRDIKNLSTDNGADVSGIKPQLEAANAEFEQISKGTFNLDSFEESYDASESEEQSLLITKTISKLETIATYTILNRSSIINDILSSDDEEFDKNPLILVKQLTELRKSTYEDEKILDQEYDKLLQTRTSAVNELYAASGAKGLLSLCSKGSECCLFKKIESYNGKTEDDIHAEFAEDIANAKRDLDDTIRTRKQLIEAVEYLETLIETNSSEFRLQPNVFKLILTTGRSVLNRKAETSLELINTLSNNDIDLLVAELKKKLNRLSRMSRLAVIVKRINKLESSLAAYSKSAPLIKILKTNLAEVQDKLPVLQETLSDLSVEIDTMDKQVTIVTKVVKALKTLETTMEDMERIEGQLTTKTKELNRLTKQSRDVINASSKIKELMTSIEVKQEELEEIQDELSSTRIKLTRINEFTQRKEALEVERKLLAIVKEAVDIKTGIPLVLVGDYLKSIRDACNKLLGIAYKGRFYIDFAISDKEFAITVFKNGRKSANDVRECSQGEISLVKTSLSLGIITEAIRTSVKQYNVVCLDEIDAELDPDNRLVFLDIVYQQLDNLNSSQCFVITHNNCFFDSEAGLVLLPGHKFDLTDEASMENKDIIFLA